MARGREPFPALEIQLETRTVNDENQTGLAKGYSHREVEARWYPFWRERGYFHGDEHDSDAPAVLASCCRRPT